MNEQRENQYTLRQLEIIADIANKGWPLIEINHTDEMRLDDPLAFNHDKHVFDSGRAVLVISPFGAIHQPINCIFLIGLN